MVILVALLGFVVLMKLTLTSMYETDMSLVEKNEAQQISFQTGTIPWKGKDAGSNASAELAYTEHFLF